MTGSTWSNAMDGLNALVGNSPVGRYFEFSERRTTFTTELRAGTVTFLTIAYILAANPNILTDSGGTCTAKDCSAKGNPFCIFDPTDDGYNRCLLRMKASFISATAASTLIACFLMGALANMPLAVAPGMGINAFFTYTVVGFHGSSGMITYQEALAAAFIEGWIFILLSITGMRTKLIQAIPKSIMLSTAGGIGMFLAFIGLQTSEGIGLVTYDSATLVTLGGCPIKDRIPNYSIKSVPPASAICSYNNATRGYSFDSSWMGPPSGAYTCEHNRMRSGSMWLGIFGGILMVILMGRNFRGSIITGILFITFISWIPGHAASYLGKTSQIPGGQVRYDYFMKGVAAPDISATAVAWSFKSFGNASLWAALISFLYLDFLDCTGTLFSMATFLNRYLPGFIDPQSKTFPKQMWAFVVDGFSIVVGSLMGIAPLTVFIESATGIKEGGRTGMTAIMISFYFFLALFFAPIIASIPGFGTGPALIMVGALMMENLLDIPWSNMQHAIPAFMTIVCIPLTYSIAYGVIAGVCTYLTLYILFFAYDVLAMPFTKESWAVVWERHTPDLVKIMRGEDLDAPSSKGDEEGGGIEEVKIKTVTAC